MAKKRTSLDSLFTTAEEVQSVQIEKAPNNPKVAIENPNSDNEIQKPIDQKTLSAEKTKSEIVKQTVYLPSAVHEQLRQLAFEERKKMHDYLVEGLDRVFKDRGLKPYSELSNDSK